MNDNVDASSKYQDSLPVSSDAIMEQLDNWGIAYTRADHVPLRTVEESKRVQGQFLSSEQGGGHIKNLYLRDNKKRNVLLVAEQDRKIDLKTLNTKLGTGRLSFGSAERLMENLGVRPGAVTPLAMINGVETGVQLFIDSGLNIGAFNTRAMMSEVLIRELYKQSEIVNVHVPGWEVSPAFPRCGC